MLKEEELKREKAEGGRRGGGRAAHDGERRRKKSFAKRNGDRDRKRRKTDRQNWSGGRATIDFLLGIMFDGHERTRIAYTAHISVRYQRFRVRWIFSILFIFYYLFLLCGDDFSFIFIHSRFLIEEAFFYFWDGSEFV